MCVLKLLVSGHKGHPAGRIPRQLSGKVLFEARESRKGPADAGFSGKLPLKRRVCVWIRFRSALARERTFCVVVD